MKNENDESYVESILKFTKNVVKKTKDYKSYINNDNSFILKQLPIINYRKVSSNNNYFKEKIIIKNQKILNSLRLERDELKNMPKLFSIFSNEEMIPNLLKSSKIKYKKEKVKKLLNPFRNNNMSSINNIPLRFKRNNSSNMIGTFDEYEKDFFWDIDYSNLTYDENEIFRDKNKYDNIVKERVKMKIKLIFLKKNLIIKIIKKLLCH